MATKTVGEVMTRAVITLLEEDNLVRVAEGLDHYRFHHLPVVDGGRVVGMLSLQDLLRATVCGRDASPLARSREAHNLETTFVRDVMSPNVVTIEPTATLAQASRKMLDARIGALPVVDEQDTLIGIVTQHDVMRWVAEND